MSSIYTIYPLFTSPYRIADLHRLIYYRLIPAHWMSLYFLIYLLIYQHNGYGIVNQRIVATLDVMRAIDDQVAPFCGSSR